MIIDYHDEPQNNLRSECKRVMKILMESHKDWKSDVLVLKKNKLDKIDRILKNFGQKGSNSWIES